MERENVEQSFLSKTHDDEQTRNHRPYTRSNIRRADYSLEERKKKKKKKKNERGRYSWGESRAR